MKIHSESTAVANRLRAQEYGDGECRRIALLSQEGSVIAFFAMTRGVVPKRNISECILNEYAHDLDCCLDRAALLTQEGNSANFHTSSVLQIPVIWRRL